MSISSNAIDLTQNRSSYGGERSRGLRKVRRPLDQRKPIHLVLIAKTEARGTRSFLGPKNRLAVDLIFRERARQFGVKIHGLENRGDHIHLVASFTEPGLFQNFLRTVTALIARFVTGARRGRPFGRRFWDCLAFTRVLVGRQSYALAEKYLGRREIEREFAQTAKFAVEEFEVAEKAMRIARGHGKDLNARKPQSG